MNNLSWPACIVLGVLLGLGFVAAERTAEESASPQAGGAAGDDDQSEASGNDADQGSGEGNDDQADREPGATVAPVDANSDYSLTLTFDDGPHPRYTPQVLDLLDQYDATAIFCVVGERVRAHPDVLRDIVARGHTLCNHTDTHDEQLSDRDSEGIERQIADADDAIESATDGETEARYFRQPSTYVLPEVVPVLEERGLEPLDWTVDPRDWSRPGSASIVQGVLSDIRPGAIVLMHDGGGDRSQTVVALEQILEGLDTAGYEYALPGEAT